MMSDHRRGAAELLTAEGAPIATLDPLGVDAIVARLPEMNAQRAVRSLVAAVRTFLPSATVAASLAPVQAAAAMRDIGMFLASIKRHGADPIAEIPRLPEVLGLLGETCEMVPRETVFHYGPWNPRGLRERLFIGDDRERILIEATRGGATACTAAAHALHEATLMPPSSAEFAAACEAGAEHLQGLVDALQPVRDKVEPEFFARMLRPYFEEIEINGVAYSGPAAATIPLGVVDHWLWSSDVDHDEYRAFHSHLVRHGLPMAQRAVRDTMGQPSILTRLSQAITELGEDALRPAIDAVSGVFQVLLTFRGRHKALAVAAYAPGVTDYRVGSGGYSPDMLADLIKLTLAAARGLRPAAARACPERQQDARVSAP
jgi:monodechloroaminopyrrolnitrin synthase